MKRSLLVIALLMITSMAASAVDLTAKTSITQKNSEITVNNTPLSGNWEFSYSISNGNVTAGDISEGPIISYITTTIMGDITLPAMNEILNDSLKNKTEFTIKYHDEKSNSILTFGRCRVIDAIFSSKPGKEQKAIYTFRAVSLS